MRWLIMITALVLTTRPTTGPAVLDAPTQPMKFSQLALSDIVEFLRDVNFANIEVNWPALEAVGVERSTPVSLVQDESKLGETLRRILEAAGGLNNKLTLTEDDGVICISTTADNPEFHAREPSFVRGDPKLVEKTRESLRRNIAKIDLNQKGLPDAVKFFQDSADVQIVVNAHALAQIGLPTFAPVTIRMHDLTLDRALRLVADQLSNDRGRVRYAIDGDRILISTRDDLLKK